MLHLHALNPEQREAVQTTAGPVLILAGAGTGKTRVITFRIAHLILKKGIPPGKILAVTFTNKAAREMKERVNQLVPRARVKNGEPKPETSTICTFHSLGARILRQHIEKLGYKKNFVIYNESEQMAAVKKAMSHISSKAKLPEPSDVASKISKLKNCAGKALDLDDPIADLARHVMHKYHAALHACNAVDFDDLLVLTLKLFKEHPAALEEYRNRFQYVMVDEYQDTNAAQFEMLRLLTSGHQNLCVVGDDDQSIYGWRGAEITNLLQMEKYYPKVKVIKLEQNYRSTNTILMAANAVIKHNPMRRPKQLWSQKGQGSRIVLHTFENEEEEAKAVVDGIECARMTKRIPWGKQSVLFRTNQQSRALETAFRTAKVRYHLVGGQSYFDRREIKDFLAYLKMFINPHDDVSLLRIANVPARGLSDTTMERLLTASQERKCSVFAVMRHTDVQSALPAKARESLHAFLHFIDVERGLLAGGTGRIFSLRNWGERWLEQIGYWDELRKGEKDKEAADNRIRNLKELVHTLDNPELEGDAAHDRLNSFLENISLETEREEDDKENAGDAVTLITMHSCKGLEYPHVFIVGMEEGILPHARSMEDGTEDEERRIFYVAITRAQETLSMSHCLARSKYGQKYHADPSRFLKELPQELVERADDRKKQILNVEAGKARFADIRAMLEGK